MLSCILHMIRGSLRGEVAVSLGYQPGSQWISRISGNGFVSAAWHPPSPTFDWSGTRHLTHARPIRLLSRIFDIGIGERDQDFSNGEVMTHETQALPEGMIPCLERKPDGKNKAKHIREEKEKKKSMGERVLEAFKSLTPVTPNSRCSWILPLNSPFCLSWVKSSLCHW